MTKHRSFPTISLALTLALSGPLAGYGKQSRLGMMLRVDELNEQGGVHGRKIKLEFVDTASDPGKARAAVQRALDATQSCPLSLVGAACGQFQLSLHARQRRSELVCGG